MVAVKRIFTIGYLPGHYEGYCFTGPDDNWNGYAMPWLPLDVGVKLAEDHSMAPLATGTLRYKKEIDSFVYKNGKNCSWDQGDDIPTQDGWKHLYQIGAGLFEWKVT